MLTEARDLDDLSTEIAPERRSRGKRHRSVLLFGKVRRDGVESACVVHDVSRHGLMARFPEAPTVGETLVIEVRGLPPAAGTVRWVKGRKAGFQFAEPQAVERVLQIKRDDGLIERPPRFPFYAHAMMRVDGERFAAETLDISAGGIKLIIDHEVQPGQTGQMTLVDTDIALFGRICWVRDGQFGFRFTAPLSLDALADILAR